MFLRLNNLIVWAGGQREFIKIKWPQIEFYEATEPDHAIIQLGRQHFRPVLALI